MDVREVHVRAVAEVVAAAQVDVAERLEVRDLPRPHAGLLRRGEAEEELGRLRDQVGARELRGHAPSASAATAPPSKPPPAKPRRIDVNVEELRVAEALLRVVDVRAHVGAEQDRDVVLLEPRVGRVAGKAARVDQHRLAGAPVVRQ